ncbi:glycosyltransferase [Thiocapsa sp. N5-Cardenillas]|uniref:glycosyltransferase n=1 Tax=Thiocapsa sp. N5-Cardenillas TaxID=3137397 RepID=UPI0035AF44AD
MAAGVLGAPRVPCHLAIVHDLQSGLAKSLEMTRVPVLANLITWLERQTLNRVDRIVTLSQDMVEAIRTIGVKTPIDIIPPTVDDTLIRPLPVRPGPFTALYSGNVTRLRASFP